MRDLRRRMERLDQEVRGEPQIRVASNEAQAARIREEAGPGANLLVVVTGVPKPEREARYGRSDQP